jgi:hypothetical protein
MSNAISRNLNMPATSGISKTHSRNNSQTVRSIEVNIAEIFAYIGVYARFVAFFHYLFTVELLQRQHQRLGAGPSVALGLYGDIELMHQRQPGQGELHGGGFF